MHRIVAHIQEKRLLLHQSSIYQPLCLQSQSLCQERRRPVILLQVGNTPYLSPLIADISIILLTQITAHRARSMAGHIIIKTDGQRVGSRSIYRSEMSLAHHHGRISVLPQYLRQALGMESMPHTLHRTKPVIIPLPEIKHIAGTVSRRILMKRPVRNPVLSHIRPRKQADARRRTDRASIRMSKLHPLRCQTLHMRRTIQFIQASLLRPEGQRRILPPHIVHQKKQNIRPLGLTPCHSCLPEAQKPRRQPDHRSSIYPVSYHMPLISMSILSLYLHSSAPCPRQSIFRVRLLPSTVPQPPAYR